MPNHCDTIWNIYAIEGFATIKGTFSNRCDTIWNIYAIEGFAIFKSNISNRFDTIWNSIACFFSSVRNKSSFTFIK